MDNLQKNIISIQINLEMKILLSLILFISSTVFAQQPAHEVDILHYKFEIALNDSTDVISCTETLTARFNNATQQLDLDLMNKNPEGKGMEVLAVSLAKIDQKFNHKDNRLTISLNEKVNSGSTLTFTISYQGIPDDGMIISKNKYGDRTFFGDNWPDRAHHWLPVIDHPSDKASVEFIVTAPDHYEVIGNGIKLEESALGKNQKLTHWKEETPIPTKVMVIGAARFAIQYPGEVNDISVEHWVYPQNRQEGFHDYAAATKILDYFINNIGPYPFQKLANVQSKTKYGGMENASNIFYAESSVSGNAQSDDLIAHEIAHQWFGNSASEIDWHHVWLSEGFATYFQHLYNENTYGEVKRQQDMDKERKQVIDFFKSKPLPIVFTTLPTNLIEILSTNSYQKGSWVLHMLRQEVGNEAFWKGIRQYYHEYKTSNASTADFQRVMETASGNKLDAFFRQWLYSAGHPELAVATKYDERSGSLKISLNQKQQQLFSFPLEIGFYNEKGELTIEKLKIDTKSKEFNMKLSEKPVKTTLDPNVNLLFEGNLRN
jgi:aminopeptidase N